MEKSDKLDAAFSLGAKKVGTITIERKPDVDFSSIADAKRIGTVGDLMRELCGAKLVGTVSGLPFKKHDPAVDLPELPDDCVLIVASDGVVYDIPADDLDRARAIDPDLRVLVKVD